MTELLPRRPLVRSLTGVVSTGHPSATSAGCAILARGGNAVDAAVAAAYALMVVLPHACGPGGDAFALVSRPQGTEAFNGSGAIPALWDGVVHGDGAAAATVPGAFDALDEIHRGYGLLTRQDVCAPAISLAREGFAVTDDLVDAIRRNADRLGTYAADAPYQTHPLRPGEVLQQPALAETFERLGRDGARCFYEGPEAAAIARRARAQGSTITAEDFAAHRTVRAEPVSVPLGDATLYLTPPASQAVLAGIALRSLHAHPAASAGAARVHLMTEAVEAAFQRRATVAHIPWQAMIDEPVALSGGPARRLGGAQGSSHTTAVAVADSDGLVVSLLVSVFHEFGSAAYIPEAGFVLNDRMRGLEVAPPCGNRPVHTLSPAVLALPVQRVAVATPGADAQVQVIAQVLDGLLAEGLTLTEAIDRPRWRLQGHDVVVERSLPRAVADELTRMGHTLVHVDAGHRSFGSVVAAGVDNATGSCFGAADLRRESTSGAA